MPHVFSRPLFYKKRSGITEEIVHGTFLLSEEAGKYGDDFPVISSDLFNLLQLVGVEIDVPGREFADALSVRPEPTSEYYEAVFRLASSCEVLESELVCKRFRLEGSETLFINGSRKSGFSRFLNPYAVFHILIVAACKQQNLSISDYWVETHPIWERIYAVVGRATKVPTSWGLDDSGFPTAIAAASTVLRVWDDLLKEDLPVVSWFKDLLVTNPMAAARGEEGASAVMKAFSGRVAVVRNRNGACLVKSVLPEADGGFSLLLKFASRSDQNDLFYGLLAALNHYPFQNDLVFELKNHLERGIDLRLKGSVDVTFA